MVKTEKKKHILLSEQVTCEPQPTTEGMMALDLWASDPEDSTQPTDKPDLHLSRLPTVCKAKTTRASPELLLITGHGASLFRKEGLL